MFADDDRVKSLEAELGVFSCVGNFTVDNLGERFCLYACSNLNAQLNGPKCGVSMQLLLVMPPSGQIQCGGA
jgi:hypothetical protein